MDRRDFLSSIGVGAAFALTASCLGSCKKQDVTPSSVDFTVDLTASSNAALKVKGGYIIQNQVVIAQTLSGTYAAATVICSHQGESRVVYDKINNQWYCGAHGATFAINGSGVNNNGKNGLSVYKTTLTGNSLRVYS